MFAENWQVIRKEFRWHNSSTKRLAALLYAIDNKSINCLAIKDCLSLIKSNTGIFSTFRGNMALCIATMLSLKENRDELFWRTITVFEMLRKEKYRVSDYLAVAAYEIAVNAKPEEYQQIVIRTRAFYNRFKASGFLLRCADHHIFFAMLGLSDINIENGTDKIELLCRRFKSDFSPRKSVQKLVYTLLLGGESDRIVSRVLDLRNALKNRKIRFDKIHTLPSLGILALLPMDIDTIVRDLEDAVTFLKTQKGFGLFSITKQELLLFAAGIVASVYAEEIKNDLIATSTATSIASIIIAQQTAAITTVVVASAASSASARGK